MVVETTGEWDAGASKVMAVYVHIYVCIYIYIYDKTVENVSDIHAESENLHNEFHTQKENALPSSIQLPFFE